MDKKTEALKLAEDALKRVRTQDMELVQLSMIALAAIREALAEQPAQQNVVAWESDRGEIYYDKEDAFRYSDGFIRPLVYGDTPQAQPAQQQEPVRVPVADNTYNYAKSLAEAIFKQHFASDEHYSSGRIVWGVNDTVIGILTQIDNMVADMVRRPAQQEPVAWMRHDGTRCCPDEYRKDYPDYETRYPTPLYAHPAAQGSPVAWMVYAKDGLSVYVTDNPTGISEGQRALPLYTSPQAQRTWVGLTDDEILYCVELENPKAIAEEVEAKLREKNA